MTIRSSPEVDDPASCTPKVLRDSLESVSGKAGRDVRIPRYSWVNAWLERAEEMAGTGHPVEAYGMLGRILESVLERPQLLEIWMDLLRSLEPHREEAARQSLQVWVHRASAILEAPVEASPSCEAPLEILSRTLAQLYWKQGHREQALDMYRALVRRHPDNRELLQELDERLAEVKGKRAATSVPLRVLEHWAERIQRRRRSMEFHQGKGKG
jgi:tetratricopeptide (TPR) repeat protein